MKLISGCQSPSFPVIPKLAPYLMTRQESVLGLWTYIFNNIVYHWGQGPKEDGTNSIKIFFKPFFLSLFHILSVQFCKLACNRAALWHCHAQVSMHTQVSMHVQVCQCMHERHTWLKFNLPLFCPHCLNPPSPLHSVSL